MDMKNTTLLKYVKIDRTPRVNNFKATPNSKRPKFDLPADTVPPFAAEVFYPDVTHQLKPEPEPEVEVDAVRLGPNGSAAEVFPPVITYKQPLGLNPPGFEFNSGSDPGDSGSDPGDSGSDPGDSGSDPGDSGSEYGELFDQVANKRKRLEEYTYPQYDIYFNFTFGNYARRLGYKDECYIDFDGNPGSNKLTIQQFVCEKKSKQPGDGMRLLKDMINALRENLDYKFEAIKLIPSSLMSEKERRNGLTDEDLLKLYTSLTFTRSTEEPYWEANPDNIISAIDEKLAKYEYEYKKKLEKEKKEKHIEKTVKRKKELEALKKKYIKGGSRRQKKTKRRQTKKTKKRKRRQRKTKRRQKGNKKKTKRKQKKTN